MLNFLDFIEEARSSPQVSHHAEVYFWDDGRTPSLFRLIRTGGQNISEGGKAYTEQEDILDGELHRVIGKFTPSKYDHDTIAREFHKHLFKNGYYMHTETHPLVMSPKDQRFKSEFKKAISKTEYGKKVSQHELPHHDGSPAKTAVPGQPTMGRYVGLWSTKGSTAIFDKDTNKPIEGATVDNHVSIINDREVKHAASGEMNRWFLRAGEIRKIPKGGLVSPSGRRYGNDIDAYIADKRHNTPKHQQNVSDYFNDKRGNNATPEEKAKTLRWIKKNHPDFDPTTHPVGKRGYLVK
jgi:hypothetical protein